MRLNRKLLAFWLLAFGFWVRTPDFCLLTPGFCLSIQWRTSLRPRLPSPMHPQPLLRISRNIILDHLGKCSGIGHGVGFIITGSNQLERGIETDAIFAQLLVPQREPRHYGGICVQRHAGQPGGGACRHSEEIYERPLRRCHIRVHKNANGLTPLERTQQTTGKVLFWECAVAVARPIAVHHCVQVGIVEGTNDDVQRVAVQGMKERSNLPSSKVRGYKQDAFAPSFCLSKILKTIVGGDFVDILWCVSREKAEFGHLPPQVFVHLAQNSLLLFASLVRKGNGQIAHPHSTQARIKHVGQKAYSDAKSPGHWPREQSKELCRQPYRQIFKPVSHSGRIWTVTSAGKYFKLRRTCSNPTTLF